MARHTHEEYQAALQEQIGLDGATVRIYPSEVQEGSDAVGIFVGDTEVWHCPDPRNIEALTDDFPEVLRAAGEDRERRIKILQRLLGDTATLERVRQSATAFNARLQEVTTFDDSQDQIRAARQTIQRVVFEALQLEILQIEGALR
ncbi:MAG: hypothetical protein PHZ00_05410 [Candidatus Peribacteraceae bacterium]|nr:hypothetical protein [Candidatus Peribacteraceae bacterium]